MKTIIVTVSSTGETTVEAEGFKGKGCEAATKAVEEALGKRTGRRYKKEYTQAAMSQNKQQLGG
jgi:hypothetical protein